MKKNLLKFNKINLGSGKKLLDGYLNVDIVDLSDVDYVIDLEKLPWALPDNHYIEVNMDSVLEHLSDTVKALEELHRITKDGAVIKITVPYFASYNAFRDPTHKSFFAYGTFSLFFTKDSHYNFYTKARFQIKKRQIIITQAKYGILLKPFEYLINLFPKIYQKFFCFMFPSNTYYLELITQK